MQKISWLMWTPSTCDCECGGACKIGEYLILKIVHGKNVSLIS